MGELIQLSNEDRRPRIVCPHCKDEILMDIMPFKDNVAQVMVDKCPKCGGEIFVGLLILCHPSMEGLGHSIQLVVNTLNTQNQILGGKRQP